MADLTYQELRMQVQALAQKVAVHGEQIRLAGQQARTNAQLVARHADSLANLEVDPQTTGEAKDTARIMNGLTTASVAAASATDSTVASARAADAQARASHDGIAENVNAMVVRMAKAAFYKQE
jgi:hypothetical protein